MIKAINVCRKMLLFLLLALSSGIFLACGVWENCVKRLPFFLFWQETWSMQNTFFFFFSNCISAKKTFFLSNPNEVKVVFFHRIFTPWEWRIGKCFTFSRAFSFLKRKKVLMVRCAFAFFLSLSLSQSRISPCFPKLRERENWEK